MLLLRSRGAVDAPHCRSHVARLHTAGQDAYRVVRLPPGTYGIELEANAGRTAVPGELVVRAGGIDTVPVVVEDLGVRVRLRDAATAQPISQMPPVRVVLTDQSGSQVSASVGQQGVALLRRVRDGNYRLDVIGVSSTKDERGVYPARTLFTASVTIQPGGRELSVEVPPR